MYLHVSSNFSLFFPFFKWCSSPGTNHSKYALNLFSPPPARYGGRHTVTLIPGDGIGPELLNHVRELFRSVSGDSTCHNENNNSNSINSWCKMSNIETNHTLPPSHKSRNNLLRTGLDLYANVMHCQSLPGVQTRHKNIDIIIIRENTEGEYSSLDLTFSIINRKLADGLFLQCCKEVASGYPDITFDSMIVDNTTMQLVSKPHQFDVMVMPNLYGNVVSNVCAGLVGGPGLVPGANLGSDYAVFETATRNTGKSIAGRNIANPTAMLLASCLMLDHLK
uniref:Isocitrate dehydrogenase (NAD(+)) 3 non-catalytic subunit gamma n=1 Tax=Astyanax mexicanus TaxID=7994 RepID=A0A8B9HXS2_ASTMX